MTATIDEGFRLIESGDYSAARARFSALLIEEALEPASTYNAHFGLALCLFHD